MDGWDIGGYGMAYSSIIAATQEEESAKIEYSLSEERLSEHVYVIQPEESEAMTATELLTYFYGLCGALYISELIEVENLRGIMIISELLKSLEIIKELPNYSNWIELTIPRDRILPYASSSVTLLEVKLESKLGYKFENREILFFAISTFYKKLYKFQFHMREIGRRVIHYVAAVNQDYRWLFPSNLMLAQAAMFSRLHRRLYIYIPGDLDLSRAIASFPERLVENFHDDLTKRASAELAHSLLAIIGAVFVDGQFSNAAKFVNAIFSTFPPPPPRPPPPPPKY